MLCRWNGQGEDVLTKALTSGLPLSPAFSRNFLLTERLLANFLVGAGELEGVGWGSWAAARTGVEVVEDEFEARRELEGGRAEGEGWTIVGGRVESSDVARIALRVVPLAPGASAALVESSFSETSTTAAASSATPAPPPSATTGAPNTALSPTSPLCAAVPTGDVEELARARGAASSDTSPADSVPPPLSPVPPIPSSTAWGDDSVPCSASGEGSAMAMLEGSGAEEEDVAGAERDGAGISLSSTWAGYGEGVGEGASVIRKSGRDEVGLTRKRGRASARSHYLPSLEALPPNFQRKLFRPLDLMV